MSTSTHQITYEESLTMPESDLEEVIDGELLIMPPATKNHNSLILALERIFDRQMRPGVDRTHGTGFLLRREPLRYRIPDLAIVDRVAWKNDLRTTSDPYSHIVPELIAEIISPANRRGAVHRLLENYADFKVPEVLLFHPETRVYESYRGLTLGHTAKTGTVSPQTMSEVVIDLDLLWEEF
jgi:Uma2 family endonuclease